MHSETPFAPEHREVISAAQYLVESTEIFHWFNQVAYKQTIFCFIKEIIWLNQSNIWSNFNKQILWLNENNVGWIA